ncbi:MAG: FtsX-like permease family protein [Peptoniphilus harei]|uniref:Efflux ABC transporter, permease protein n=3 Tax=Peptoniphilus TaxID=162289 RepID=E4KWG7_9FIRM|nr:MULTISPECIES: FtsX-like permease family protein [Peptoniphilus]EFR33784.1 efflux ABC transporter, permease protein [Peptoniphilus harei ACS-146-V-Sch2b]KXA27767.1 efflux ABC transporter, permease protein [Peptoniphilus harei]MDK7355266.1 FtsX-like permease family protein [Peptoniphilus harei]MDK7370895.1 FtsX-like permease family protein [Peptoniphilus harei]MDK7377774.1 FtsX-like permease family protein [Peptoniphilus harei]
MADKQSKNKFYLKMIMTSLARRRARMLTALLAIAMGATIISGLVTIYYDIPRQMGKEFRSYGANMLVIPTNPDKKITNEQLDEIKSLIPSGKLVGQAPYIYTNAKINEQPYMLAGTDLKGAKKNSPYWLIDGSWPEKPREVLIGNEVSKALGLKEGDKIIINTPKVNGEGSIDTNFVVSGVVTTGGKEEELIFMGIDDISQLVKDKNYDVVEYSVEAEQNELSKIVSNISQKDGSLTPQMVKRVTASQDIVLNKLQALVFIVTIIVLFIMMICVSTTMMAVVTERRKEIGLKKALGATNSSVIVDFLGEGAFLGVFGGLLGVALGYIFANRVSISVFARKVSFLPLLVPMTIIVCIVITIVASLIPVSKTVDIDPALVLRGE